MSAVQNLAPKCSYHIGRENGATPNSPWLLCSNLGVEVEGDDVLVVVEVRKYWDGEAWWHFKPCYAEYGDRVELWTSTQYGEKYQALVENEGEDAAKEWSDAIVSHRLNRFGTHVADPVLADVKWLAYTECQKMIGHFKLVVALGLVDLAVTL